MKYFACRYNDTCVNNKAKPALCPTVVDSRIKQDQGGRVVPRTNIAVCQANKGYDVWVDEEEVKDES